MPRTDLRVAVVCAGTSDLPVAEEAAFCADALGHDVVRATDVGVAGIHRLYDALDSDRVARAVIVVAGMEGALPSVVAGLVRAPVIAVPTSVGYGAAFDGLAALLAMLDRVCARHRRREHRQRVRRRGPRSQDRSRRERRVC